MESSQAQKKPAKGKLNATHVILGIALVAILILAATTVLYYNQAKDYRDAKYKAQAVLVMDAYGAANETKSNIEIVLNDSWTLDSRRYFAMTAQGEASLMSDSCIAIAYMYPSDDGRYETFFALSQAAEGVAWMIGQAYAQLNGPGHTMNATVTEALNSTAAILGDLYALMMEGYDTQGEWLNEPYSMVDRMDLGAIDDAVAALNDALGA
jgi:hypothetical protein